MNSIMRILRGIRSSKGQNLIVENQWMLWNTMVRCFLRTYRTRIKIKMTRERIITWRINDRDTLINY